MPKRLSKEIRGEIKAKALENLDGPQIEGHLEELMKEGKDGFDHVPNLRTVQQIMKAAKHEDSSGPWRLTDTDPDVDAAVVMRVLADVAIRTLQRRRYLTKAEARLVSKIGGIAPKLAGFDVFILAREYLRGEESEEDLDLAVALASVGDVTHLPYKTEEKEE